MREYAYISVQCIHYSGVYFGEAFLSYGFLYTGNGIKCPGGAQ